MCSNVAAISGDRKILHLTKRVRIDYLKNLRELTASTYILAQLEVTTYAAFPIIFFRLPISFFFLRR